MPRSFARKMAILGGASFITYLEDAYPGTIIWDGQALAGATVQSAYNRDVAGVEDSALFPKSELVTNGGFDSDVSGWTPIGATFEWDNGVGKLTVAVGGVAQDSARQSSGLTAGKRYVISARMFAPSTNTANNAATISLINGGNSGDGISAQVSAEDVWETITFEVIPTAGQLTIYLLSLDRGVAWGSIGDVAYFDNISIREVNPLNADAIGATPAQTFSPPQIPYAWSFDGSDDYLTVNAAALAAATNIGLAYGEIMVIGRVENVGVWTDTVIRDLMRCLGTTGPDVLELNKFSNNNLQARYRVNLVDKTVDLNGVTTVTPFAFSVAYGDGSNGDFVTSYFNAVEVGTVTSAGYGNATAITEFNIGAAGGAARFWHGDESIVIWSPVPFTDAQRSEIVQRAGIS